MLYFEKHTDTLPFPEMLSWMYMSLFLPENKSLRCSTACIDPLSTKLQRPDLHPKQCWRYE
jgi:hypothetical protein